MAKKIQLFPIQISCEDKCWSLYFQHGVYDCKVEIYHHFGDNECHYKTFVEYISGNGYVQCFSREEALELSRIAEEHDDVFDGLVMPYIREQADQAVERFNAIRLMNVEFAVRSA